MKKFFKDIWYRSWRPWEWFLPALVRKELWDARNKLRCQRAHLKKRVADARFAETVIKDLRATFPDITFNTTIGDSITTLPGVIIFAYVNHVADAAAIATSITERGFDADEEGVENREYESLTWIFTTPPVIISLRCFFRGDACRWVEVGVEEKPVYELQCSDEVKRRQPTIYLISRR